MTGTWVALGSVKDPAQDDAANAASVTAAELPAGFKPGAVARPNLRLFAPSVPGDYLLILDVFTPEAGSLTARGVEPPIIRVTVAANAAPAVTPAETPAEAPAATDATTESFDVIAPRPRPCRRRSRLPLSPPRATTRSQSAASGGYSST